MVNMGRLGIIVLSVFWLQTSWAAGQIQDMKLQKHGMEVWGLFIQPVKMKMADVANAKQKKAMADMPEMDDNSDLHLEAKIYATDNNPWGFIKGAWIPYLTVGFQVEKLGSEEWMTDGKLMPMVANNGPHYGANVKLNGIGKYKVTYYVSPPSLMIHTDKETAATDWWMPFSFSWEVTYTGIGKKGGY